VRPKANVSKWPFVSWFDSSNTQLRLVLWLAIWWAALSFSRWVYGYVALEVFQVYFPLKCPLKLFLGITCPTCGLGRSVILFLAGQIRPSFDAHFLGPIVVVSSASASLVWASWPSLGLKFTWIVKRFRTWIGKHLKK
jgi:hypothetical protein